MTPRLIGRNGMQSISERDDGFTLIELLGVIVILGILAAVAVFAIGNTTTNSAQAACKADFSTVQLASEAFKSQVGGYPGATSSYFSNFTLNKASTPANYKVPAATGSPATDLNDGVLLLMSTSDTDANNNSIGPWLRNAPVSLGHYEIVLSDPTGTGTDFDQITVYAVSSGDVLGSPIPAAPTYSVADCSSVK